MESAVTILSRLPLAGEIRRTRIERCMCGGSVRAYRHEPAAGVRNHQRTTLHKAWRTLVAW